ncbi:MAG: dehypoxanthine futalosine cyclase [Candidatus Melainabacteria bacterium GWA2_34_9]|nr:MAG: dehypoxanthine futalosine cyclase [Candidatus Melainabacteria bacterium GWA2_34_9]
MRINKAEALKLLENNNILEPGQLADEKRQEFHPDNEPVTFVVDRNINYTNICTCKCKFCAFHKDKDEKGSYVLDYETIKRKIDELVSVGGTQLLLQGGLNPDIPLYYYLELVKNLRKDFPSLTIHSFSPSEISFIAKNNKLTPGKLLEIFIDCGLSSIPGGGAEILCDEIRQKISPNKISSQEWLDIMEIAHGLGLKTTATMVFGFGEKYEHVVDHLFKIRELQDKTGGFSAFIPWTFASNVVIPNLIRNLSNEELLHESQNGQILKQVQRDSSTTAHDYLKILAVSRLVLDNIPNIQASWVTQGLKIAQLSLRFGANDFGGTMLEENVVKAAGIANRTTICEIIDNIKKAGFKAAQRNTTYEILRHF